MKKLTSLFTLFVSFTSFAQPPAGYYATATGTGYTLKTQLHNIIDDHTDRGYGALWGFYETADVRSDGFVWDVYSNCDLMFGTDQDRGSGGNAECDKFNREHTFPQSWFNRANPMRNDAVMVLPTDKRVNAVRGSFPYSIVRNVSYTSSNSSKSGTSDYQGYSGTAFEPADGFKGDIARIYFYMATRYEDIIATWQNNTSESNAVLDGSSDQVYEDWVVELMLLWHMQDPVSQKEMDRNNDLFDFQSNRNPFVDHPEWVNEVWGDGTPTPVLTLSATASINLGTVSVGSSSQSVSYQVNGSDLEGNVNVSVASPFELSLDDNNWQSQVALGQANVEAGSNNTVYVRFSPQAANGQTFTTSINHTSTNANSVTRTVTAQEGSSPVDNISKLRAGSNGQSFTIEGIVTSPELSNSNGQYYVQDETGGVIVFDGGNPGLVNRGDLVRITGERDVFRTQVQIELEINGVEILASNQSLPAPQDIDEGDLSASSNLLGSLVRITGVSLPQSSQWPTSSTSSGTNVDARVGATDFTIRIDENSFYDGTSMPSGTLVLIGVLDVFDGNVQIYPFVDGDAREEAQLNPSISVSTSSLDFGETNVGESTVLSLNLAGSDLFKNVSVSISGNDFGLALSPNGSFSNSLLLNINEGEISQTFYVSFSPESIGTKSGSISLTSSNEEVSVALNGLGTEITTSLDSKHKNIYPNPTNGIIHLSHLIKDRKEVMLFNSNGQRLSIEWIEENNIDVSILKQGVYYLKIDSAVGSTVHKVLVE